MTAPFWNPTDHCWMIRCPDCREIVAGTASTDFTRRLLRTHRRYAHERQTS